MINFLKKLFIAEFDWSWKDRWSFFWYQFVIIISIFILIWVIFWIDKLLRWVEIYFFPHCWKYCSEKEIFYWKIIEIINNILFIISFLLIFRFNSSLIERFSFFRFSGFLEKIFLVILTFTKIFIIWIIIFLILNFVSFFYWNNLFFIYEILNYSKESISYLFLWIIFVEIFMFFLWMILWRKE